MNNGCPRIWMWPVYVLFVFVVGGCLHHLPNHENPTESQDTPQSQESAIRPICAFENDEPSCFYRKMPSKTERSKLIIFVHGVTSTTARTWGTANAASSWPSLLNGDDRFADYDFYFINYLTSQVIAVPNIHEIADNQLARLKHFGVFHQYKEIYFVAHSMGGLVVKSLLVNLNHGDSLALLRQVKAVIYLGTPALGNNRAAFRGWFTFNPQFSNMELMHSNPWLSQLERSWVALMEDRKDHIYPKAYCVYETLPTFPWGIIVPEEMANGRCDEGLHPFTLNHSDLAAPTIRGDDPYLWVMGRIDDASKALKPVLDSSVAAPPHRAETCGPVPFKTRSRERFVPRWVNHINALRKARGDEEDHDLQNLMPVRREQRTPVDEGSIPESILIQEAIFTLKCLEKEGQLRTAKPDHPSMVGGLLENQRIIFLKPMMTVPE